MSKHILKILYKMYKLLLSPFLGNRCRFYPSCSDYAYQAIDKFGWLKGGFLAFKRIVKCNPLHPGGFDTIEEKK